MPPLGQAGSFALVTDRAGCGAVTPDHDLVSLRARGQFCSHLEIENGLSAGAG